MIFLVFINTLILSVLAGLHFYWAVGGQWGFAAALPTKEDGTRILNPKMFDTILVGLALLGFALFHPVRVGLLAFALPAWLADSGLWVIGGIFMLRAIGDFNYVGFFKKRHNTPFAKNDNRFYSPLCLLIGSMACLIEIYFKGS